jgi:hypothetical protein
MLAAGRPSADAVKAVQRSAGNAAVMASMAPLPVQRASAYVATGSRESQGLAQNFSRRYGLSSNPADVRPGETLWVIGHGHEIGSGTEAAHEILRSGFRLGHGRQVRLVVCNAGRHAAGSHASPAQNIANILQTTVHGSTVIVQHVNGSDFDLIEGAYQEFQPQGDVEDITSRMAHLSTRDATPVDEITQSMRQLTLNANGWAGHDAPGGTADIRDDGMDGLARAMRHLSI